MNFNLLLLLYLISSKLVPLFHTNKSKIKPNHGLIAHDFPTLDSLPFVFILRSHFLPNRNAFEKTLTCDDFSAVLGLFVSFSVLKVSPFVMRVAPFQGVSA